MEALWYGMAGPGRVRQGDGVSAFGAIRLWWLTTGQSRCNLCRPSSSCLFATLDQVSFEMDGTLLDTVFGNYLILAS